jgi:hypothetical protein
VLPFVDIFIADRFFVWAPILRTRLALRLGAQLADGPCVFVVDRFFVWALVLRMCLSLHCGAQPLWMSFAFGRPSYGHALRSVGALNLPTCRRALRCSRTLGCATCGRALNCVGAPNFQTGLGLCLGAHLADVPCVALGRPTLVRPY